MAAIVVQGGLLGLCSKKIPDSMDSTVQGTGDSKLKQTKTRLFDCADLQVNGKRNTVKDSRGVDPVEKNKK